MSLILFKVKCVSLVTGDMFSCNVERDARHNQQCHLRQDNTDDFDWTCSRDPLTGPDFAMLGRNYLYAAMAGKNKHKVARQEYVHSNGFPHTYTHAHIHTYLHACLLTYIHTYI